jgi:HD-like signal output (HDOD) protein
VEELRRLVPLRGMDDRLLQTLGDASQVLRVPRGTRFRHRGPKQQNLLFLIAGEIQLLERDGETQRVPGGSVRANFPLIPESGVCVEGACTRESDVLRLPVTALAQVRQQAEAQAAAMAAAEQQKTPEELLEQRIFDDFRQAIDAGRLELPGMPEVASRISLHIDSPQSTSASIARIVQMDPSITARLIQVSNSAAFAGRTPVKSCKDAVTRLGRNATRELVTSFVLKGLFRTRSRDIKQRMQRLWRHSTKVAALCHVLAKRCGEFEPARAMLIGLVHDIGVIPILTAADRYEGLTEDPALLEHVIDELRGEIGAHILRTWGFAEEFAEAALEAEDWLRDKREQADYADLLIIAQLHALLGTARITQVPRMDEVPAFSKLALSTLSPRMSLVLLDEAQQEIDEVELMLV